MAKDARVAGTGVVAVVLVDAELEALGVDVLTERLDAAGEAGAVRLQVSSPGQGKVLVVVMVVRGWVVVVVVVVVVKTVKVVRVIVVRVVVVMFTVW